LLDRHIRRRAKQQHAATADQQNQQPIEAGPDQVLRAQREHRLQQHRIGQQRQEAADIRGGIEEIRIGSVRMPGADEPRLQQRIVGRKCEERQADRHREQPEQPEGVSAGRRLAPAIGDRQWQRQQRDHQQHQMHHDRNDAIADLHQIMRIGIAAEQQRLKKHHRHRPHRRRAAEPGQHHFREQRLHREQQQCTGENRGGIDDQDQPVSGNGSLIRGGRHRQRHEGSGLGPADAGGGQKLERDLKRMASHRARSSYAGLTRVSINLRVKPFRNLNCRVKPYQIHTPARGLALTSS
jgi:hypothetical protein